MRWRKYTARLSGAGDGGYTIRDLSTPSRSITNPEAQTLFENLHHYWHGVDTNFVWRGPDGLRLNGGTSTGRTANDDTCDALLDIPHVKGREGNAYAGKQGTANAPGGCLVNRRWETRINGSVAYVIPWADVLVSTIVQSFAGVERSASPECRQVDGHLGPGKRQPRVGAARLRLSRRGLLRCDPEHDEHDDRPARQRRSLRRADHSAAKPQPNAALCSRSCICW